MDFSMIPNIKLFLHSIITTVARRNFQKIRNFTEYYFEFWSKCNRVKSFTKHFLIPLFLWLSLSIIEFSGFRTYLKSIT